MKRTDYEVIASVMEEENWYRIVGTTSLVGKSGRIYESRVRESDLDPANLKLLLAHGKIIHEEAHPI